MTRGRILSLFLLEGTLLAGLRRGRSGRGLGGGCAYPLLVPLLPVHTPWSFVVLAELLLAGIGILASALPARQAARLDPLEVPRSE